MILSIFGPKVVIEVYRLTLFFSPINVLWTGCAVRKRLHFSDRRASMRVEITIASPLNSSHVGTIIPPAVILAPSTFFVGSKCWKEPLTCLLYTSDAADERSSVD